MFQDFLRKQGRHPEPNPGGFHPDWDIRDEDFTYEVKLDRKVQETGNVYVERKSLFNSKADYLVYLFHVAQADPRVYFIFIAPAAKVRNFYRRAGPEMRIVGGNFKEPGMLLNESDFLSIFRPLGWANA